MSTEILSALLGGSLIGLASAALLFYLGRIAGISGILSQIVWHPFAKQGWRWSFLLGLLSGGLCLRLFYPAVLVDTTGSDWSKTMIAGLLVGLGTSLAGGCTSGHGVCGVGRLSPRSILATLIFVLVGMFFVTSGLFTK